jgi:L-cysteine:1D-myo-inositol 2-amino-2-deoxy-alpha-D-glucopyranoside ligase
MRLFDTYVNGYTELEVADIFKMYVCGITPYDSAHLGHIFTFMTYDLLQRRLEDLGHSVQMVRNITDVDEPIYTRAAELKMYYTDLAEKEISSFQGVMKRLNFRPLYSEPKASEYINDIAEAVKYLLEIDFGYYVDKDIYFDVSKFKDFGVLSGFSENLKLALLKKRGGDPDRPGKRSLFDFLLWRNEVDKNDPAQWKTDIGSGRPGWHIECSVMSSKLLGSPFDLHGGGTDLVFPHHDSEIAQSFALTGHYPARYWMHVSPILYAGEIMSKSLGNLIFARDLLKKYEPACIRLALMHYHHRIGGEWQTELLEESRDLLAQLRKAIQHASKESSDTLLCDIRSALDDDINTLGVIDALYCFIETEPSYNEVSRDNNNLIEKLLDLLGLDLTSA